ncbi:MAG TPA: TraR/DksA C4-type zinc finger protein [Lacipirellulaceae bacterium]|nr:TraR/DksA C4-type zinc finger protein [Lacipirellulaceae bacterium]
MKKMTENDLQKYRRALKTLSSRVRNDATGMVEQARSGSGGNSGSELSNAPLHLGDMGTEEFLYDMNTTLLANEQYIVAEAREALDRMDRGTFGICESCGRPIGQERLAAIPFTRFCVKCAATNAQLPQGNVDEGRPHSPPDTLAPEGEMHEDGVPRTTSLEFPPPRLHRGDVHAAGTAGGGTAVGGLAGGNEGDGEPIIAEVDEATASGNFDIEDDRSDDRTPRSGRSGGAVGGTPARKRAT